jgi:two-component system, NarL family, response regulator YdfI
MERAGLESLVAREPALTVVGHAGRTGADIETLSQQVEALDPDVLVVALPESEDDSLDAVLESLARSLVETRAAIVLLSDAREAMDALRYGVRGLLPRAANAAMLAAAVSAVAAGLVVLHADVIGTPVTTSAAARRELAEGSALDDAAPARSRPKAARGDETQDLTTREMEVLHMLAEGLGNKQIAARLGISDHTVKFHVASIFSKLHASTRTEAVMLGARKGLVVV